ncbi:MAG: hypothetical protein NZM40_06185 [Sphingomonadaceae bacterium]|nr:hypothetical protein [Sphingomonadaceae bacterium]MDW8415654.1 hypothetical protein [Thermaurantiacus sp.]
MIVVAAPAPPANGGAGRPLLRSLPTAVEAWAEATPGAVASSPLPAAPPAALAWAVGLEPTAPSDRQPESPPTNPPLPPPYPAPSPADGSASSPLRAVRIEPAADEALTLTLTLSHERDRARVEAESHHLAAQLRELGATLDSVRIDSPPRPEQGVRAGGAEPAAPDGGGAAGSDHRRRGSGDTSVAHHQAPAAAARPASGSDSTGGRIDRYA